jgi:hypothetical protein
VASSTSSSRLLGAACVYSPLFPPHSVDLLESRYCA